MSSGSLQTNAMTIDVEDYFQVKALEGAISRDDWDELPVRVAGNTSRILDLLARREVHATFFVLGWVAERCPALVKRIADEGHEIASHGYAHQTATELSRDEFLQDVTRSRKLLQDLTGASVDGYRAPSFSINESNLWAFECLASAGYRYSSSTYPIAHDHYGMPSSPRFAYRIAGSELVEIPITTVEFAGRKLPGGGGGYFRLLPYAFSKWAIERVNRDCAESTIFYFHPWEIDVDQPRVKGLSLKSKFRHYVNLGRMESKLQRLLEDFRWDRIDRVFQLDRLASVSAVNDEYSFSRASSPIPAK